VRGLASGVLPSPIARITLLRIASELVVWRIGVLMLAVLAVGAGVLAYHSHQQRVRHDQACATYVRALDAVTAQPGVSTDRSALAALSTQDQQEIAATDSAWDNAIGRDETVLVGVWEDWVKSFRAQALAARGC